MTYPPQQPNPYGQQPGPHGQQPPGGFPPGGQQPHYGSGQQPFGQPQYGQPGPYGGVTQQFPPQQPYGQSGGFGGPPPPPKKKTGLIIGLAIAAVVVIGGAVTLFLVLNKDGKTNQTATGPLASSAPSVPSVPPSKPKTSAHPSSPNSPGGAGPAPGGKADSQQEADAVVSAYNAADATVLETTVCRSIAKRNVPLEPGLHVEAGGPPQETGDMATMPIKATLQGQTVSRSFTFKRESGLWCYTGPK